MFILTDIGYLNTDRVLLFREELTDGVLNLRAMMDNGDDVIAVSWIDDPATEGFDQRLAKRRDAINRIITQVNGGINARQRPLK